MTFTEALTKLGINKYADRIYSSNSHGELFHLEQYITLAESIEDTSWFPEFFDGLVKMAEDTWERPESVFQHVVKIITELTLTH